MLPGPKGEDRRLYHRSVSRLSKTKVPSLQSVQYHSSTEVLCTCNFRNLHHSPRHLALVTIPSLNNQFGRKTIIRSGATSHMSLIPILFHLRTLSALNNDSRGKRAAPQYQSDELPNRYTSSLQQPSCTLHRIHNRASSCPSIDIRPADAIHHALQSTSVQPMLSTLRRKPLVYVLRQNRTCCVPPQHARKIVCSW